MKIVKLAGVLLLLYVIVPTLLLGKNFPPPEAWTRDSAFQFFSGIFVFGMLPHGPACIVLFIMMASKGIHDLTSLREQKSVFWAAVLVLVAHLGMAILMGGKPVEFGMLVNFFLVPLLGAVAIVSGIIIGRVFTH